MKFTIITPTVNRESLSRCCYSVNRQTYKNWEHILFFDAGPPVFLNVSGSWFHENRIAIAGERTYRNGGNTPRHLSWHKATGDWVYYLDDDNYLADEKVLENLANSLEDVQENWALVPIHRHGSRFYFDPPQPCYFDTGNAVVRREIAQWPNIDDYASDAIWLSGLLKYPYVAFPAMNPVMVMEGTSFGAGGGINGK